MLGIALFTAVVTALALLVQVARSRLGSGGTVSVLVNGRRRLEAAQGTRLSDALALERIRLPSACGGTGACGLCRVRVTRGGDGRTPIEDGHLGPRERAQGLRLACQLRLRDELSVEVPEEALGVSEWTSTVSGIRDSTPLIRELVLAMPEGVPLRARAGSFVEVTCRPYSLRLGELAVAREHESAWARMGVGHLRAGTTEPVTRAYSVASHPGEPDVVRLDVRLALPPPGSPGVPPGVVSTWLFSLREGDAVPLRGPHGHFFIEDDDRELILVGGGVGLAPLRAHLFDQLECRRTRRRIGLWYGARSRSDLFGVDEIDGLARAHDNFSWTIALSEPRPEDAWEGATGFIHRVLHDEYLVRHPAPEDCAYYLCGPPMMLQAVLAMLEGLGVERESIVFDDFGAAGAGRRP